MPKDGRDSDLRRVLYGIVREVTGENKTRIKNQRRVRHKDEDIIKKEAKGYNNKQNNKKNNNKEDSKDMGDVSRKGDEKDKRGGDHQDATGRAVWMANYQRGPEESAGKKSLKFVKN